MNIHIKKTLSFTILILLLLIPCLFILYLLNSQTIDVIPSEVQQSESPSSPTHASVPTTLPQKTDPDVYNIQCVKKSNDMVVSKVLSINNDTSLKIDARVNTANVERVSLYEYIPTTISDEQRTALFESYFQERADEVYHHTVGNSNCWVLMNDTEYYHFNYGIANMYISEPLFALYNAKVGVMPFTNNMLNTLNDVGFPLNNAYSKCESLIDALVDESTYIPDIVRPFNTVEPTVEGFYWITYRREIDGMPLVANYDLKFFATESEVIELVGTLYNLEEKPLKKCIISVDEALSYLEKYSSIIDCDYFETDELFPGVIPVTEITFEYLVLQGTDMNYTVTPVWRFQIGETEEQRLMNRDKVIAINALTGDLIAELRGIS